MLCAFQSYRDKYREYCGGDTEMHIDMIFKWIETQAIILSPICPHVSEQIWQILGKVSFGIVISEIFSLVLIIFLQFLIFKKE